ncbi:hypothetical protein B0T26DRAFT_641362 [Lasiosphaeria miniovina]|uniref:DUF7580 domain-containing protein n=1 Tax=Lasiosphaeria miniovina TaxID=1954250 RepID=A0AA40AVF9_9PEZI|nr:uncharacterized protein B0T26DRAFT_641362 [Lasiosphaeria miniovina]KAK0722701.1 hypothetical protein B0T26DRAFT_641362 [Lasiosphaeria miniovina]
MSGVEFIVGVVLGAVPIAVLAFEQYGKLSAHISTFRNPREIVKLQSKVSAQRTIFRNNAINLLSAITNDRELVRSMLSAFGQTIAGANDDNPQRNPTQSSRHKIVVELKMSEIYRNRIDSLEESLESCHKTILQIVVSLEKLVEELSGLAGTIQKSGDSTSGRREWLSRVGARLKLVVKKPELLKAIEDLRNFNSDFNLMANQVIGSLNEVKRTVPENTKSRHGVEEAWFRRTATNINSIEKYRQIRHASTLLYETLANSWTCSTHQHESHAASVSCVEVFEMKSEGSVKFDVALTSVCASELARDNSSSPLWLEVEHIESAKSKIAIAPSNHGQQQFDNFNSVLAKYSTPFTVPPKRQNSAKKLAKAMKRVRFNTDNLPQMEPSGDEGPVIDDEGIDDIPERQLVNLMLIADLCQHFHTQYLVCQPQQCLGYLGGRYLQRFYRPPPNRRFAGDAMRLDAIISWINENSFQGSLPLPATFHIAGSLAASVLQFHSTPWLPETWRSQDVNFFTAHQLSAEDELRLSYPYFKVEFGRRARKGKAVGSGPGSEDADMQDTAGGSDTMAVGARNELLFRFGIVLLEVGFSRSWATLRERVCRDFQMPAKRQTDYHVAEKLCAMLANQMGAKYPRIIRKCIGCDFGLREPQDDLEKSEELQAGFLVDVVIELQRMKEGVRALGSAS